MEHNKTQDEIDPVTEALTDAEQKLRRLKRRHQLTNDAQRVFAELGSRVDAVLEERRSGQDRRGAPRPGVLDRRAS